MPETACMNILRKHYSTPTPFFATKEASGFAGRHHGRYLSQPRSAVCDSSAEQVRGAHHTVWPARAVAGDGHVPGAEFAHYAHGGGSSARRGCHHGVACAKRKAGRAQNSFTGLHCPLPDDHGSIEAGETRCHGDASRPHHSRARSHLGGGGLPPVGHCGGGRKWGTRAHGDSGSRTWKSEMKGSDAGA